MKLNINYSSQDNLLTRELSILSEVVAQTQAAEEVVTWSFGSDLAKNRLLVSLLKVFKDSEPQKIDCPQLDQIAGFSTFKLNPEIANKHVKEIEAGIAAEPLFPSVLKVPLSYLLDELVCNMQQHSGCTEGSIFVGINPHSNCLDVIVADHGITIYGSYVNAGKYLEYVSENPAEALSLAKDGFSTKNRPDAENRGYGISSNARMVVEGLNGSFSIISGSAVYLYTQKTGQQIIGSSDYFEWGGTTVIARIPLEIPPHFSFYDYIS